MASWFLIESREPGESPAVNDSAELAAALARRGDDVTLFLVQNGVLPLRPNAQNQALVAAAKAGVKLRADDFSLRERGITGPLAAGAQPAPIDVVVDAMAAGTRVTWH